MACCVWCVRCATRKNNESTQSVRSALKEEHIRLGATKFRKLEAAGRRGPTDRSSQHRIHHQCAHDLAFPPLELPGRGQALPGCRQWPGIRERGTLLLRCCPELQKAIFLGAERRRHGGGEMRVSAKQAASGCVQCRELSHL